MKNLERARMRVEVHRSLESNEAIATHVSKSIWTGRSTRVRLNGDDVAAFLRLNGWQVRVTQYAGCVTGVTP